MLAHSCIMCIKCNITHYEVIITLNVIHMHYSYLGIYIYYIFTYNICIYLCIIFLCICIIQRIHIICVHLYIYIYIIYIYMIYICIQVEFPRSVFDTLNSLGWRRVEVQVHIPSPIHKPLAHTFVINKLQPLAMGSDSFTRMIGCILSYDCECKI